MNISHVLRPDLIITGGTAKTKDDALKELLERIFRRNPGLDHEAVAASINEREQLSPTMLPNGLWLPHARIADMDGLLAAVYIPREPLSDCEPSARMMILILTSFRQSSLYLNVMSAVVRVSHDPTVFDRLTEASSGEDFIRTAAAHDVPVSRVIQVGDLMIAPPWWLEPAATVKDALDLMYGRGTGYIPVCRPDMRLLGEVTVRDILRAGLPDYARTLDNVRFMSTLEPLEDLLEREDTIPLSAIMQKPLLTIDPRAPILELIFQFIKNSETIAASVVENRVCIGIVSYADIIEKFLRI